MVHLFQWLPELGEGIKWRDLPWICVIFFLSLHCHVAGWFEIEYFYVVKKHVRLSFLVFRVCCGRRDGMFSLYATLAAVSETSLFPLFETLSG